MGKNVQTSPTWGPDNTEELTKEALIVFVSDSIAIARVIDPQSNAHVRRSPNLNPDYDRNYTEIEAFDAVVQRVKLIHEVNECYGATEASNLVLQFLYTYLDECATDVVDDYCFESVWARFRTELTTKVWRQVGLTILQNFQSSLVRVEIADGVAVCLRKLEHVDGAIGQDELDWLMEDWMAGAHGSHALIVEHREPKNPDNVSLTDGFNPSIKLGRALLALRLLKEGRVRTGRFYYTRPALFPARLPGRSSSAGAADWRPGTPYVLEESDVPTLREIFSHVESFDRSHMTSWKNVDIALRRFSAVYDVDWNHPEDRVVDAVIAIEALLGTDQEITYRLSTRVAGIMASTDAERVELYENMKLYYETRSKIVHGADLKAKHNKLLNDDSSLIDLVRRLLKAFLQLATGKSPFNSRNAIDTSIDTILLDSCKREQLRRALRLI